ncbi:MAG: hypothetical protein CR982_04905 [Candidatus Cloacimonadota bacterium]|nr:MAG: hypothetical protein CR982_04905 [Candidatus Cloacimonadota bacterium]PIE77372.1 MAG: hypothetical protein CSA15_13300 [Candidatus Delongbacteria bacterium]
MKQLFLAIFILSIGQTLLASTVLAGRVLDSNGRALKNVEITIVGSRLGTVSDRDGNFYLKTKADLSKNTIKFAIIGYDDQFYDVKNIDDLRKISVTMFSKDYELEEVVVTTSMEKRFRRHVPENVETIPLKEIESGKNTDVASILDEMPGLNIEENGYSRGNVKINGLPSQYSLVLVDGERTKGGHNGTDLSQIPVSAIKRIEVVKGPSSSLFGSDAIGGVVNIITKEVAGTNKEFSLSGSLGSKNRKDYKAGVTYGNGVFGINLNSTYFTTEGVKRSDKYKYYNNFIKTSYRFSPRLESSFSFNQFYDKRSLNDMSEKKYNGKYEIIYKKPTYNVKGSVYWIRYDREFYSFGETKVSKENDYNMKLQYSSEVFGGDNIFVGSELRRRIMDSHVIEDSEEIHSMFSNYEFPKFHDLSIALGFRLDYHKDWGFNPTPKLNLLYSVNRDMELRFSFGQGFKAPSLEQLHSFWFHGSGGGFYISGNKNLSPEKSLGFNLSSEYRPTSYLKIIFDGFYNKLEDMIIPDDAGTYEGKQLYKYRNFDHISTYGGTIESRFSVENYRLNLSYNLTHSEDRDGNFLPNTALHTLGGEMGYSRDFTSFLSGNILIKWKYKGESYIDSANEEKIESYNIFDLHTSLEFFDNYLLKFDVNNLLDKKYKVYSEMPSRAYSATLSVKF